MTLTDPYDIRTSLYVLTYNSPDQFEALLESFKKYDQDFLKYPRKILIDNSTNSKTTSKYNILCRENGFEHIKRVGNTGISGGRQFVSEHFGASNSDYYIFFEDDMNLCESVDNLYRKSLAIIDRERYDFLKISFMEVFGNNNEQWAWYGLSKQIKDNYFPHLSDLSDNKFRENFPQIIPTDKKYFEDLGYYEGEYYYCNWPLWFSKEGNKKVFLNTRWENPHEHKWMESVFLMHKKGLIKSACLEVSPIHHYRFDDYPEDERKES